MITATFKMTIAKSTCYNLNEKIDNNIGISFNFKYVNTTHTKDRSMTKIILVVEQSAALLPHKYSSRIVVVLLSFNRCILWEQVLLPIPDDQSQIER